MRAGLALAPLTCLSRRSLGHSSSLWGLTEPRPRILPPSLHPPVALSVGPLGIAPGQRGAGPATSTGPRGGQLVLRGLGRLIKVKSLKYLRHLYLKLGSIAGTVGICWCPGRGLTPWRGGVFMGRGLTPWRDGTCRATTVARGAAELGIQKLRCA